MGIIITFFVSLIFAMLPLVNIFKGIKNKDFSIKKYQYDIIFSILLFVGSFIRLILIDKYPVGIHQDEASIGYEAYSLLNFGFDRNGLPFPVHFISWGSGQNVLYGYMIMPLLMLFGNSSILAIRLPMAIFGCLTLLVAYKLCRDVLGDKKGLFALFIIVICPWHIMKSRFGLESNIFPDLIFYAIVLIYYGIKNNKKRYLFLSSIILGISTYSYGTAYLFVPVLMLLIYIYLIKKKYISIKYSILFIALTGLVSLPMILFVIVNYFKLETLYFFDTFTVPKLYYNRFTEITSVNGNFLFNCYNNFKDFLKLFVTQSDNIALNQIPGYGIIYPFSTIFVIIGIYYAFKKHNSLLLGLINCMFFASLVLAMFTEPNINRMNVIWVVVIAYMIYGLLQIIILKKELLKILVLTYFIYFICFSISYFSEHQKYISLGTSYGIDKAISYAEKLDYNNLYIDNSYIRYIWYTSYPTDLYIKNKVIPDKMVMFQQVTAIGNKYFVLPEKLEKGNVYIIQDNNLDNYEIENFTSKHFTNFTVLY